MLYRSGGLPVINNCLGKACAVDFVCQIGLHALSEFCIVIIRHVIEGRGQHIGIGESFDGLSERIGKDFAQCKSAAGNLYLPSVMVTHLNEYAGIDTDFLRQRFGKVYLSDGRTAQDVVCS